MCHIVTSVIDTVASDHGSTDCSRSISDLRGTRGVMGAETDNMSSLGGGCCYNHFHLILGGVIRQCCNMETQAYISLITLLRSDIGWCCQDPSTWQIGGPQYLSIFSTDDDDLVLTRVRHSCFCISLQGEIQYSFDRQAVLDKSKKTLGTILVFFASKISVSHSTLRPNWVNNFPLLFFQTESRKTPSLLRSTRLWFIAALHC